MAAAAKPYVDLRTAHIDDHQRLFNRVRLDLGAAPAKPTDERLAAFGEGAADPALETLLFQYGRHLLMGSSRPGDLPATLQGIWNQDLKPAWYCAYTTNINVQMNSWLAEPTALPECHLPLLAWIRTPGNGAQASRHPQAAHHRRLAHLQHQQRHGRWLHPADPRAGTGLAVAAPVGALRIHRRPGFPAHGGLSGAEGSVRVLAGPPASRCRRAADLPHRVVTGARPSGGSTHEDPARGLLRPADCLGPVLQHPRGSHRVGHRRGLPHPPRHRLLGPRIGR